MHTLKQNKGIFTEHETGEDVPAQGISPARAMWASSGRKCSRPNAHPSTAEWRLKDQMHETLSQQIAGPAATSL